VAWQRELVTTPAKAADSLAALEAPEKAGEAAQFAACLKAVEALLSEVSEKSAVLVTLSGHRDPNAEGFDARNVSITVSRVEPEEAKRKAAELEKTAKEAEAAERQAEANAQAAREAADKAAEEAAAAEEAEAASAEA
jgi:hypothetical protein